MSLSSYQALIAELGRTLGMADMAAGEDGYVGLMIDDHEIHIQHEPEDDEVILFARLPEADPDRRDAIYAMLLAAKVCWQGTGGGHPERRIRHRTRFPGGSAWAGKPGCGIPVDLDRAVRQRGCPLARAHRGRERRGPPAHRRGAGCGAGRPVRDVARRQPGLSRRSPRSQPGARMRPLVFAPGHLRLSGVFLMALPPM